MTAQRAESARLFGEMQGDVIGIDPAGRQGGQRGQGMSANQPVQDLKSGFFEMRRNVHGRAR